MRTRVFLSETFKELGVPTSLLNKLLDAHRAELLKANVSHGRYQSDLALEYPGGSEHFVLMTDIDKKITYVGLPEEFS